MKFSTRRRVLWGLKLWQKTWFGITLLGITGLWGCTFLVIYVWQWKDPNAIGDSFGMVNSLFSGCAFAFLIYTTWMQRRELELQRKELKLTRMEMAQTTLAHQKHVELVELQIENEKLRNLAQYKPNLQVKLVAAQHEDRSIISAELRVPMNKCVLERTLVKLAGSDEHFDRGLLLLIEPNQVIKVKEFFELKGWGGHRVLMMYTDIQGNTYHREAFFNASEKYPLNALAITPELLGSGIKRF